MSNAPRQRPRAGQRTAPQRPEPRPQSAPFDLDALERDGDPGEYQFVLDGVTFVLADPHEVGWQEAESLNNLLAANDIQGIMRRMLGDQYEEFVTHPLPAWKLQKLGDSWMVHYGLGEGSA